ncbi:beta-lactamase, precursor [Mycolicibacterium canariasense]|uniref:Beta-lactamase n=1 Tax=Mycolicibacterium canariasense TaxID=228230 RepID=A0A117I9M1_MYCCR|nr:serine hydrolase domain-containing protein [Mycolicibacterium canariasense]MCV7209451.1 beta-lactamase family protein [Mycolicibacterium canariasense]GAS95013.1 beta-lactamase, precursor [Mycolicibacterium canariasense]
MQTPELGAATGDADLIARLEPLARAAGLGDRLSVVCIRGGVHRHAHFGAGPATVYEIGSVTKTLTALLFAEAIESGELRADTRVGTLLDLAHSPAADVTLEELASHRSGLPRVATGLWDRANAIVAVLRHRNPYTADLQRLLGHARSAKIVSRGQFSYSNLGAALLGQALAAHAGTGFPELLHRRLFTRIGMTRSSTPLSSADLPAGAPTGWSARGTREQAWTLGAYAPAGGVRSTAADMAIYAQALLDGDAPGLTALEPRWDAGNGSRVGYAWFTDRVDDVDIAWHNGATGGFSSMLALDRRGGAAVVILANTAVAVDEIALRLLVEAT